MSQKLTTNNHSRDIAGLKYVYPVISRRAGGLSIGINFNTNNACNWRCIYCQVPDLKLGAAPEMDFQLLEAELRYFLNDVLKGHFYQSFNVPKEQQQIKDIAISGNGEPTSLKKFSQAIALIGRIATEFKLFPKANFVLISNGSLLHQAKVQQGLAVLNQYHGEVWFKLDSAIPAKRKLINNTEQNLDKVFKALIKSSQLCLTKLQTCIIDYQNQGLSNEETQAYLDFLVSVKEQTNIETVLLYTIARESLQPEMKQLKKISPKVMQQFADKIKMLGYTVNVSL